MDDDDFARMSSDDWLKSVGAQTTSIEEPCPGDDKAREPRPGDDEADEQHRGGDEAGERPNDNPLGVVNAGNFDFASLKPRGWLLGNTFCRRFLASLIGDGGVGKTALRVLQLLSMAIGRNLTGEYVHVRCRVLFVTFEDDLDELAKRVYAAVLHHNIDPQELDGWFWIGAPKGVKLARIKDGAPTVGELVDYLRDTITTLRIDHTSLDPLVKIHSVPENDNNAMDFVCDALSALAIETDSSIDFPQHVNKGPANPGDANRGRGASATKDAARLIYTIGTMTEQEAVDFRLPGGERRSIVRVDSAKVNIAPPSREARWFRVVGVPLNNPSPTYPHGDTVQTVEMGTTPSCGPTPTQSH